MSCKIYSLKEFYKKLNYFQLINTSVGQKQLKDFENKFKYFFFSYISENDYFITYETNGIIVGLCQIKKIYDNDLLDTGTVKIDYLNKYKSNLKKIFINKYSKCFHSLVFVTVDEKYRGKGIATKILNYLFKYLFDKKISFFHSSYFSNNLNQNILLPKYQHLSKKYKILTYVSMYGFV